MKSLVGIFGGIMLCIFISFAVKADTLYYYMDMSKDREVTVEMEVGDILSLKPYKGKNKHISKKQLRVRKSNNLILTKGKTNILAVETGESIIAYKHRGVTVYIKLIISNSAMENCTPVVVSNIVMPEE